MSKNNSNSKGRHKSRHNGINGHKINGMPTSRNAVFDSNGPCGKIRGNVSQIIEKYQMAAKDATSQSEYVLAELCLQYADHYNRINLSLASETPKKIHKPDEDKTTKDTNKAQENTSDTVSLEPSSQDKPIAEIDISSMDLSIPDFAAIKKEKEKHKAKKETVKLAIENV